MAEEIKKRTCLRCRTEQPLVNFPKSNSKFLPGKRALICTACLEKMTNAADWNEIDALMRHLDLPFNIDLWTRLYGIHKEHTLTAYFNTLLDQQYAAISWKEENTRWKLAQEQQTFDSQIAALTDAKINTMREHWSSSYNNEDLLFLENLYDRIVATQNVTTPILEEYARDLCEITLRIKKGLREGLDVKKDMDARDNIIKIGKFDAANSRTATGFESVGELMVYYGKKGWHPEWHTPPQDQIDFMMQNIQTYLQRLVNGEGNIAEQVEETREKYEIAQRLEETGQDVLSVDTTAFEAVDEYEGEDELASDLLGH